MTHSSTLNVSKSKKLKRTACCMPWSTCMTCSTQNGNDGLYGVNGRHSHCVVSKIRRKKGFARYRQLVWAGPHRSVTEGHVWLKRCQRLVCLGNGKTSGRVSELPEVCVDAFAPFLRTCSQVLPKYLMAKQPIKAAALDLN